MDNESYRHGFEATLELCLAEIRLSGNKEQYLEKMGEFLELVKEDKIDRLREMIWNIKR